MVKSVKGFLKIKKYSYDNFTFIQAWDQFIH